MTRICSNVISSINKGVSVTPAKTERCGCRSAGIATVFDKVLSNAQEAKARDAELIGVAPEYADAELFDTLLLVPTVDELLSPCVQESATAGRETSAVYTSGEKTARDTATPTSATFSGRHIVRLLDT